MSEKKYKKLPLSSAVVNVVLPLKSAVVKGNVDHNDEVMTLKSKLITIITV